MGYRTFGNKSAVGAPHATHSTTATKTKAPKRKHRLSLGQQLRESMGYGPDPPNSAWCKMKLHGEDAGEVLLSVELLPKAMADSLTAGLGRQEPNENPTLPPPVGRLDITKMGNPMYLIQSLVGKTLVAEFACVCCCIAVIVLAFFVGPPIFDYVELCTKYLKGNNAGGWLTLAVAVAFTVFACYVRVKCARVLSWDPCGCCCPAACRVRGPAGRAAEQEEESDESEDDESSLLLSHGKASGAKAHLV